MEHLSLAVDEGVNQALLRLAGSEEQKGQFISDMIRVMEALQNTPGLDNQTLLFAVRGMAGHIRKVEDRVGKVEHQLSAIIASRA